MTEAREAPAVLENPVLTRPDRTWHFPNSVVEGQHKVCENGVPRWKEQVSCPLLAGSSIVVCRYLKVFGFPVNGQVLGVWDRFVK